MALNSGVEAVQGPDLPTIQTEAIIFLGISGLAKVRLTPPWTEQRPATHASLLSIASRRGLVAAAGPDAVVVANTGAVRKAFEAVHDTNVHPMEPQLRLPMSMRVSQLAFNADESLLLLSAENGGGLAAHDVSALLQGQTKSAFELPTNGEALRSLAPNPTKEKAELCALVTNAGNLFMANLRDCTLGEPLKDRVSCVSWSTRGKQLVAGLADGTIVQLTPEGEVKATIPRPPNVEDGYHVSSVVWLENHVLLVIHTSTFQEPPTSVYNVATRTPPSSFSFQKLNEPVYPYQQEKPPHHSILRLKDFAPNITDFLILASTASADVGLVSRSKAPITNDFPAEAVTNVFTHTELADDTSRAVLPITDSGDDSIPIGAALDLSSRDPVYKPIPGDEIQESNGPLPGVWILTHEGILCGWWIVYKESIRQGVTYHGMAALEESGAVSSAASVPARAPAQENQTPTFGGITASGPATGEPVFGSSTFGSAPASKAPAFGLSSMPSFGYSGELGARSSPWATAGGSTLAGAPRFGQSGFAMRADNGQKVIFGSSAAPSGGNGFSNFANGGGFAALGGKPTAGAFANPGGGSFGSGSNLAMDTDTAFPPPKQENAPAGGFLAEYKLQSSFKSDPSRLENGLAAPTESMFGAGFGAALGETAPSAPIRAPPPPVDVPPSREEEMGGEIEAAESETAPLPPPVATPKAKPLFSPGSAAPATPSFTPSPGPTALLGNKNLTGPTGKSSESGKPEETPVATVGSSDSSIPLSPEPTSRAPFHQGSHTPRQASGSTAGDLLPLPNAVAPKPASGEEGEEAPLPPDFAKRPKSVGAAPHIKESDDDAPLSPDLLPTKASLPPDLLPTKASLPPDALPTKVPLADHVEMPPSPHTAKTPPKAALSPKDDDGDVYSEGSGVDVLKELSPSTTGMGHTPSVTPQSSSRGGMGDGPFSVRPADAPRSVPVNEGWSAPVLPQPTNPSPRSPSPVRGSTASRSRFRPGAHRPAGDQVMASQTLKKKKSQQEHALGSSILGPSKAPADPLAQSHRQSQALMEVEEARPLFDEEDDDVQDILDSEVEATLVLDEFITHADAMPPPSQEAIPSQVEAVYRDVNAMVDTLGLNSRSLAGFIKGHSQLHKDGGRVGEDLEVPGDWVLCEISEIAAIIDHDLAADLVAGRVKDLNGKLDVCRDLARDITRLRTKQTELKHLIIAELEPEQADSLRSMPLAPELAAQHNDIRREYARFAKLLTEAESSLTLFKARIASLGSSNGHGGTPGGTTVPTVDAVLRTINKMTNIAEKRSGDVDVLENQIRKLRLGTPLAAGPAGSVSGSTSREVTPVAAFATPQKRLTSSIMSSEFSASTMATPTPHRSLRASLAGSVTPGSRPDSDGRRSGIAGSPARRKLSSGYTADEKAALMVRLTRRRSVLDKLQSAVMQQKVAVWAVEDKSLEGPGPVHLSQ